MNFKKIGILMVAAFMVFAGFSFFSPDYLHAQYHFLLGANQYWSNAGVFSTHGRLQSIGTANGLRLAYSEGRYTDIVANDAGELEIEKTLDQAGENYSLINFDATWTGIDESRQGIINIWGSREGGLTSWGGSPDMGIKITLRNYNENTLGEGHLRGMEIVSSNRGIMGNVKSAYFSAESRSGTESTAITPLHLIYDQSGNVNTWHSGLYIQDNSQSNVGTNYGIFLTTTNYNQTREYGYFLDSNAGSWTNGMSFNGTITNVFDFEGTAGTSGAGYNASFTTPAAFAVPDGYIKVDIGGNTQYIYTYTVLPTT